MVPCKEKHFTINKNANDLFSIALSASFIVSAAIVSTSTASFFPERKVNRVFNAAKKESIHPKNGAGFTNKIGMEFVYIPRGEFMMGSPVEEPGRIEWESPQHKVVITNGFFMQTTEVTQGQWKAVMVNNPSYFINCGNDCPVERVSWNDAREFIRKLNDMEDGDPYRLPSEAEWEYAARAGSKTAFANGDITETGCGMEPNLDKMGWFCQNSQATYSGCEDNSKLGGSSCSGTHPVKEKEANAFGLYDMHGSVWEWCEDDWHFNYEGAPTDGSAWAGIIRGWGRTLRGGSWSDEAGGCRSGARIRYLPVFRGPRIGFRLVFSKDR